MELMAAIVPLADVGRYGNVRKSDLTAINALVEGMITRICIKLVVIDFQSFKYR
jgi:hypothetical protein